jgi:hypothetical protein
MPYAVLNSTFPMLNTNVCVHLVVLEQTVMVRIITQAVQSKPLNLLGGKPRPVARH